MGETRGQEVIGFHNWIQLYLQEKRGNIDYRGYFRRGTVGDVAQRGTCELRWTILSVFKNIDEN